MTTVASVGHTSFPLWWNLGRTTKLTCPAGVGSYEPGEAYMPIGSGAAPGSERPLQRPSPAAAVSGAGRSEARRNAPAAAVHTDNDSGGSRPNATVIAMANTI